MKAGRFSRVHPVLGGAMLIAALGACGSTGAGHEPASTLAAGLDSSGGTLYRILDVASGKAVEVAGQSGDDGARVQQWSYWGGRNQQWKLVDGGGGLQIVNANSGKCLDVDGASTADGAGLQQWSCSGGVNQRWSLAQRSDGSFTITGAGSGKCLDTPAGASDDGLPLQQYDCWNSDNQHYRIEPISGPFDGSTPHRVTSVATGKALDVAGGGGDDGATVQQWSYWGGPNQQWTVKPVNGHYELVDGNASKCLDVSQGSQSDGAGLQQWSCWGGPNQLWDLRPGGDGSYAIVSVGSGKCVDVPAGITDDGLPLQQYACTGAPNQAFRFDPASGGGSPPPSGGSLRAAAEGAGRLVGAALSVTHFGDQAYLDTAAGEFDFVTPENEMKWDATEPGDGQFDFSGGDRIAQFASQHGMALKGHTLVWHNQLPSWVQTGQRPITPGPSMYGADRIRAVMTRHIQAVVGHYQGQIKAWDVVNEAISDDPGNPLRGDDEIVFHQLGDTYIDEAFRIAHDADPGALLFYNDYGIEGLGGKADAAYNLVKRLRDSGVPIHGVGLQTHVGIGEGASAGDIAANIERLTGLGLLVTISELDVHVCEGSGDQGSELAQQRQRYHDVVAACAQNPGCIGVTVWGVSDRYSWLNDPGNRPWSCQQNQNPTWPLVFDDNDHKKPAWQGIVDAFSGR